MKLQDAEQTPASEKLFENTRGIVYAAPIPIGLSPNTPQISINGVNNRPYL